MKSIKFPGYNVVFAKDQPEYLSLPALRLDDGTVITCWQMTEVELQECIENKGKFYFKQLTFNNPLQPILPMINLSDDLDLIMPAE